GGTKSGSASNLVAVWIRRNTVQSYETAAPTKATVPVGWGAHQNDDVGGAYGRFCGHDKDGGLVHVNWRPGSEGRETAAPTKATVPVGWGAHQNDDVGGAYGRFCGHDKDGGLVHVNWRPGSEGRERADRELIFIAGISQRKNEIVWDECYMSAMVGHDDNTGEWIVDIGVGDTADDVKSGDPTYCVESGDFKFNETVTKEIGMHTFCVDGTSPPARTEDRESQPAVDPSEETVTLFWRRIAQLMSRSRVNGADWLGSPEVLVWNMENRQARVLFFNIQQPGLIVDSALCKMSVKSEMETLYC
ncbi:hypothetical protein B0H13DRAFT_1933460, partial [Mycena leptocephala]